MVNTVCIDCLPENARKYDKHFSIIAVDVIRATTTIVTAVALGRRCFAVPSVTAAYRLAARLTNPLLMGEVSGDVPPSFEMNNSPARLAIRADVDRPVILLSSSGTKLLHYARGSQAVYIACLRNYAAVANYVAARHTQVAVIGAGCKGEFREEDQLCCAWIAARLKKANYKILDNKTAALIERWESALPTAFLASKSVDYLRKTSQLDDLEFILSRIDDIDFVCTLDNNEGVRVWDDTASRISTKCTSTAIQLPS
jgi:2-phosphosulfolactate phosphatase